MRHPNLLLPGPGPGEEGAEPAVPAEPAAEHPAEEQPAEAEEAPA
jgi:hypothetical protein